MVQIVVGEVFYPIHFYSLVEEVPPSGEWPHNVAVGQPRGFMHKP